ncbi:MAG: hypothetical protein HY699_13460 [Deltaproteobacteria bacterium]|nr:hypothetical protein [Deltaproteobacteria bacterium]
MARLPRRDLTEDLAKHFRGTAEERVLLALRLGQEGLDLFLATLPPGTPRARAAAIAQRNTHRGRRRSMVMEAARV